MEVRVVAKDEKTRPWRGGVWPGIWRRCWIKPWGVGSGATRGGGVGGVGGWAVARRRLPHGEGTGRPAERSTRLRQELKEGEETRFCAQI